MSLREYSAAGGVVLNDAGEVLLLERWIERDAGLIHEIRLPKGHVEPGETDEQAALRETCEESGYCACEIVADLGTALTEWTNPREIVRRTEHYYLMRLTSTDHGAPEFHGDDEAKFRVTWAANLAEAEDRLTYGSEKDFASRAAAYLAALPGSETESSATFQFAGERRPERSPFPQEGVPSKDASRPQTEARPPETL